MRAFRVFNGLARSVDIEWTVLGQRYRFWSMTAVVAVLAGSALLILTISLPVALLAGALGLLTVLIVTARLNAMDPAGRIRELTQLKLIYTAATGPVVSNLRHRPTATASTITNTGRR